MATHMMNRGTQTPPSPRLRLVPVRPSGAAQNKLLPHSEEAEVHIVGGILLAYQKLLESGAFSRITQQVKAGDFFHPAHQVIYQAELDLHARGEPIDVITLAEELRAAGAMDKLRAHGGEVYFADLCSRVMTVENLAFHAKMVRDKATARRLIETAQEIEAFGYADGGSVDDLLQNAKRSIDEIVEGRPIAGEAPTFSTIHAADVEDRPVSWLVEGLWMDEGVGIVGGEPKARKSFLTAYMAICVASGLPVFGRPVARPGRVLMFNAEDQPGLTKWRLSAIARSLGQDLARLDIHLINIDALRLDDPGQAQKLADTIALVRPVLVVLDPLRNLHSLDENDAQLVTALLHPLRLINRATHTNIMLVHHMGKLTPGDVRRPGQRLRGSSALHGWVDSGLYVAPVGADSDEIQLAAEHRGAPAPSPFRFRIVDEATGAEGRLAFRLAGDETEEDLAEEQKRQDERSAALRARILETVSKTCTPITSKRALYERLSTGRGVKARKADWLLVIDELIAEGHLLEPAGRSGRFAVPEGVA